MNRGLGINFLRIWTLFPRESIRIIKGPVREIRICLWISARAWYRLARFSSKYYRYSRIFTSFYTAFGRSLAVFVVRGTRFTRTSAVYFAIWYRKYCSRFTKGAYLQLAGM